MKESDITIGILALQGDIYEHKEMLSKLGVHVREIRLKDDLKGINGIVIPGGESTTMNLLLENDLKNEIKNLIKKGLPVYGTCAGAILLSKFIEGKRNINGLEVIDLDIKRNAYGSQLDSFEEKINLQLNNKTEKIDAIFIRAPKIIRLGKGIEILAKNKEKDVVMIQINNILITTFHPELTDNTLVHEYFIEMCRK